LEGATDRERRVGLLAVGFLGDRLAERLVDLHVLRPRELHGPREGRQRIAERVTLRLRRLAPGLLVAREQRDAAEPQGVQRGRRVATTALALPDAYEEDAWTGVRWRVRNKTFAHVLVAQEGYTSAYRDVTGVTDPTTVLTFRSSGPELDAISSAGHPYFRPVWFHDIAGIVLEEGPDWDLVAELVRHSYCVMAPKKLAALVDRPTA